MLRLQAKARPMLVGMAALAYVRPIEEIAAVELHTRFCGQDLHYPAALGFGDPCGQPQLAVPAGDHEVVIVAQSIGHLLVLVVGPLTYWCGGPEVEGRALHRQQLSGGDEPNVDGRDVVRIDHQLMVQDRTAVMAAQIEVAMVGQVDRRGLVGGGFVLDPQLVLIR